MYRRTVLCTGRKDGGQVEESPELSVSDDVEQEFAGRGVPDELEQSNLVVDNEQSCLVLVDPGYSSKDQREEHEPDSGDEVDNEHCEDG